MKSKGRLRRVQTIERYKSTFCVLAAIVYVVVVKYLTAQEKRRNNRRARKRNALWAACLKPSIRVYCASVTFIYRNYGAPDR